MVGISLWNGNRKTKDYTFQDKIAKEFVNRSGTGIMVHKYIGPFKQDLKDSTLFLPDESLDLNELSVQDVLLGEVRDRKYSEDIFEIKGVYTVVEGDFDLSQFGYTLSGDTLVIEFHTNDTIEKLGRKFMAGDVIELMHLRDDTSLEAGVIKKFYVIHDSSRSTAGYGSTWFSHIWRVRCAPIVDTQEYRDILHNKNIADSSIDDLFVTLGLSDASLKLKSENNQSVMDSVLQEMEVRKEHAKGEVEKRSFYARHYYIKKGDQKTQTSLINWIFNSDNVPSDFDGDVLYSGDIFPENPVEGDYFIRTDYSPERLFKRVGPVWRKVSDMWRREWIPAGRILESFINNDNITTIGIHADQTFDEKQALSKVIQPKSKTKPDIVSK